MNSRDTGTTAPVADVPDGTPDGAEPSATTPPDASGDGPVTTATPQPATQAQEAQEDVQAQEIISDQALLCRHGAPFGITQDHKKLNQAFRDAQFVKAPAGITHVSKVGTPGLYQPKGV